jgi:hypothetical protein
MVAATATVVAGQTYWREPTGAGRVGLVLIGTSVKNGRTTDMATDENKALIRRLMAEAVNQQNLALLYLQTWAPYDWKSKAAWPAVSTT